MVLHIAGGRHFSSPPQKVIKTTERALRCDTIAFDHTSFPHILRSIIAFSPRQSLIVLRATCREYQLLTDSILFAHAIATIPSISRGRDIELRSAVYPYPKLPFLPWQAKEPPGARKEVRKRARNRQLDIVRVMDFGSTTSPARRDGVVEILYTADDDGFDDAIPEQNSLRNSAALIAPSLDSDPFTSQLTVRRRHGLSGLGSINLVAGTYVDYLVFPHSGDPHVVDFYMASNPRESVEVPYCRHYILHMAYDAFLPGINAAEILITMPTIVQKVSLVMAPFAHEGPHISPKPPRGPLGMLSDLVWTFMAYYPHTHLELVGVENMHASTLGLDTSKDELLKPSAVISDVWSVLRTMPQIPSWSRRAGFRPLPESQPAHPEGALDRLTLLSFENWEAELPPNDRKVFALPPEFESL